MGGLLACLDMAVSSGGAGRRDPSDMGSAAERVYLLVKERLVSGVYKAGQRIAVTDLRHELGVSKHPVLHALRLLSAGGFLVIVPQVGCRVITFEHREVVDFFRMFASLEGTAASMAAQRFTEPQLQRLREVSAQIAQLVDLDEQARAHWYLRLNREFHSIIHLMSGTYIVEQLGSGMYDRSDFFINAAADRSPIAPALAARHADHERIIQAIAERDPNSASHAASDHILGTVALIEQAQERERLNRGGFSQDGRNHRPSLRPGTGGHAGPARRHAR